MSMIEQSVSVGGYKEKCPVISNKRKENDVVYNTASAEISNTSAIIINAARQKVYF